MKLLKPTYLLRTLLLLCAVAVVSSACERNETQSLSDKLDHMIANRQVYDCQKEQRIAELRHLLSVSGLTPAQEYEINDRLFGEFHKYKLDSAIRYMERNVLLARRLGDRRKGCLSGIRLAELYSSTGMSIEAKRMLDSIDRRSVPRDMLATYYKAYNRFYQQYVAFSGQRHFRELEERYQDSVIMFADTVSVRYKLDRLYQMSRRNQSHEMEVRLLGFLNSLEPDSQLYAECAYSVGSFYRRRGDDWLARKYYMLSAMTDIRNSTKENAAFQALATLYYRHDDLFRAFRYTQAAVEDALFSNVQFRTVQMSELYSIIIASHQAKESRTKHKLQYYLVLISVLSAVLVLLFVYLCSIYIDKMDDYRKSLKKLAQDRKFDELNRRLKSTSMLEDEQDELYKNFDAIFLNLYPSFVEDFNALLTEDERIVLKQEDLLNKELRIYALLRLGITDSVKIASFLRCSLSTVYNYRTKVRNKAAISREEFEKMVMKIGTAHKTDV